MAHINIHFVCTGNTCRSAMAEAIAKDCIKKNGLNISVSSSGLYAYTGDSASENAVRALEQFGLDLSSHRSSRFNGSYAYKYDYIFFMTRSQRDTVIKEMPEIKNICFALDEKDIPDPYGLGTEEYIRTADEIRKAVEKRLKSLSEQNITVGDATGADLFWIGRMQEESFSQPLSPGSLENYLENPDYFIRCAFIGKKPVGHCIFYVIDDLCELQSLAVDEQHRGEGIGDLLVADLSARAQSEKCARILLEVRVSNNPARSLYLKNGFTQIALRKDFYDNPAEDGITMEKQLQIGIQTC